MHTQPETTTTTLTGPPDTLRRALTAAALYASSDTNRPHLARVNLTAEHIEATDGYHATRITSPEITTSPGQIPTETVARITAELDRITKTTKHNNDRTATVTADADTGTVEIVAHTGGTVEIARTTFTVNPWTITHYPDTSSLYNQEVEPDTRATFSPHVIGHLAKMATTLAGSKKAAEMVGIKFHRIHPRKPARITIQAGALTADILAMSTRDEQPAQ